VKRAQSSKLTLAAELFASGLLNSSSTILQAEPGSYERNLLLARIHYARYTKTSLANAADLLKTAVSINPASIEARSLLAKVHRALEQENEAITQDAAVAKLKAGRL
jgi:cytochrome c-type biogenesis protein CcmH/NrfG